MVERFERSGRKIQFIERSDRRRSWQYGARRMMNCSLGRHRPGRLAIRAAVARHPRGRRSHGTKSGCHEDRRRRSAPQHTLRRVLPGGRISPSGARSAPLTGGQHSHCAARTRTRRAGDRRRGFGAPRLPTPASSRKPLRIDISALRCPKAIRGADCIAGRVRQFDGYTSYGRGVRSGNTKPRDRARGTSKIADKRGRRLPGTSHRSAAGAQPALPGNFVWDYGRPHQVSHTSADHSPAGESCGQTVCATPDNNSRGSISVSARSKGRAIHLLKDLTLRTAPRWPEPWTTNPRCCALPPPTTTRSRLRGAIGRCSACCTHRDDCATRGRAAASRRRFVAAQAIAGSRCPYSLRDGYSCRVPAILATPARRVSGHVSHSSGDRAGIWRHAPSHCSVGYGQNLRA